MNVEGWKYYNHAAIPTTLPHEDVNLQPIIDGTIWKTGNGKTPLFARYTTEFDCGYETNWWYVIKDTPFDISTLKAKRRYEINRGVKNFNVCEIDARQYKEELYEIVKKAWETYPKKYRPQLVYSDFIQSIEEWNYYKVYGAFYQENNKLCGYATLVKKNDYIDFCMLKAIPDYERLGVNVAICNKIVNDHNNFFKNGGYLCDGARNVVHETAFQEYLIKYFEFRKAYCKLEIVYNPKIKWLIKLLYPFRKMIANFDNIKFFSQISAVLKMEEISQMEIVK